MPKYIRRNKKTGKVESPYWWFWFPQDPETKREIAPRQSSRIPWDAPTAEQRKINERQADILEAKIVSDATHPFVKERKLQEARDAQKAAVPTFRVRAQEWLDAESINHDGHRQEVSNVTQLMEFRFNSKIHGRVLSLGDLLVTEINMGVALEFRSARLKRAWAATQGYPKRFKPSSLNRLLAVLRTVLSYCVPTYLDHNPLLGSHVKLILKETYGGTEEYKGREFRDDEFDRCIAVIKAHEVLVGIPRVEGLAFIRTAVETCLRRGSLLEMEWAHYHETHFIPLNAKVSIDFAPVTGNTQLYFNVVPRINQYCFGSFWVDHQPWRRRKLIKREGANKRLERWLKTVCTLAGVPYGHEKKGITPHSTRHTGATWALEKGARIDVVMELGGWESMQMFKDHYVHTNRKDVIAAAERMIDVA